MRNLRKWFNCSPPNQWLKEIKTSTYKHVNTVCLFIRLLDIMEVVTNPAPLLLLQIFTHVSWRFQWLKWQNIPDSKVHGVNMGPTWFLSAPDRPHACPMNLAIWDAWRLIGVIVILQGNQRAKNPNSCQFRPKFIHDTKSTHSLYSIIPNTRQNKHMFCNK